MVLGTDAHQFILSRIVMLFGEALKTPSPTGSSSVKLVA